MEQYWMPKKEDAVNLRRCLDWYSPEHLYIRDCGGVRADGRYSARGMDKVDVPLAGRTFDFHKDRNGLHLLIDEDEVFLFPLRDYSKGFSLAYERVEETDDGIGRMVMLGTGIDPYDRSLPEPRRSILRNVLDAHLIEISFKGRVDLRFHSWWEEPHWKYWAVDTPRSVAVRP